MSECQKIYYKSYREKNKHILKEKSKAYREENKTLIKKRKKEYYEKNKTAIKEKGKVYREKNKSLIKERKKDYYEKNKEKVIKRQVEYSKSKLQTDVNFKLKYRLRKRINHAIKAANTNKCKKSINLVGCSINHLKLHLESKFQNRMTWDNYGLKGWHIDHIKPCASFDLSDPEQQKTCFNYTNLQPLWAKDNLSKGAKIS